MTRPRIGLALGSGSARGWAHIGVIEGLIDAGFEPDIVCGCSIGSIVGAAYVADRLSDLKAFAQSLTWREVVRLLDVRLSGGGLINGNEIVQILRNMGISSPISSFAKPFAAIATDLMTGREVWLREGRIDEAVRASISLPGIFSPAPHGDQWLVDGGLVNPVPVSACRALGADIVIAVNLNGDLIWRPEKQGHKQDMDKAASSPPEFLSQLLKQVPNVMREHASAIMTDLFWSTSRSPGYFDVLMTSINVMQDQITRSRLAGEPPHIMLTPRLGHIGLLEFNRAAEAIDEGRARLEEALPILRRYT